MPVFLAPLMNTVGYVALGGLAAAVIFGGVQTWRLSSAHRDVATARQHQAEAEGTANKVNEIFARHEAEQERARAAAIQQMNDEQLRLRSERDSIETRFKNVSADRAKLSAENRRLIANASKADQRELGPTMRSYFARLRQSQIAMRGAQ